MEKVYLVSIGRMVVQDILMMLYITSIPLQQTLTFYLVNNFLINSRFLHPYILLIVLKSTANFSCYDYCPISEVAYIHSEGQFPSRRLNQMLEDLSPADQQTTADAIFIHHVNDLVS